MVVLLQGYMADAVLKVTKSGDVGIGTSTPASLLHVSAGTSGDATLLLEADTDNNNEDDQPFLLFKQDGGQVTGGIGFEGGSNNLRIKSSEKIQIIVNDSFDKEKLVATIDENGINDLPLKTGYYSLHPSAFRPFAASDLVWSYSYDAHKLTTTGAGAYYVPVILPDGAVITEVACWWTANSNPDYVSYAELFRINFAADTRDDMMHLAGGADTNRHQSIIQTISFNEIDNRNFNYALMIFMKDQTEFYGARTTYTYRP